MEKCKRDKKTGRHSGEWTDEIVEYLVEIFEGRPVAETREMINKRFGTHFSHEAVKDRGYYLGLKSGTNTGRFRSGVASGRGLPVGTVAFINYNGSHKGNSLFIKVSDTVYSDGETYLNWKPYKEYVWEQHNGKIPDNCFIVFKFKINF